MAAIFNSDEVFQMAMQLEETRRTFYEALAHECPNRQVATLCGQLAGQEMEHYNLFKKMREQMARKTDSRRLSLEELDFVTALLEDKVVLDADQARKNALRGNAREMLDLAIKMEKDSVLFYAELAGAVGPKDAAAVQEIIKEEKKHVRDLIAARRNLD